jgi:type I restriction enzyme S subunit
LKFQYYALRNLPLQEMNSDSAVPGLNRDEAHACRLRVPDLHRQRSIASILGTLDEKIDLNRRMNETLEAMSRALFKSWFVDFDPVRAKVDGRWRRGETLPGLPAELYDHFPDRLVDSELGEIPEGWEVEPLGDLIELAYGKSLPKGKRNPGNIPVYGSNGRVGWHDQPLIDQPGIIVGRKGNPGLVKWSPTAFFPIDTTFFVVPKHRRLGLPFLLHLLETQDLQSIASDSAVPGLNRNLAYMNRVIAPTTQVERAFTTHVASTLARQHGLNKESRTLSTLRDTLLPKLISGEIRVSEVEMAVETVA